MRAIKLMGQISADHTLRLELPPDVPQGPAEVIVLVEDRASRPRYASLEEFVEMLEREPHDVMSKEEIDRYLEAERNSWE